MSNYVNMGDGSGAAAGSMSEIPGLDDPSLSQEEKDLRLALALQQAENETVVEAQKKRLDAAMATKNSRTGRSGAVTGLTSIRKQQATTTPQSNETSDYVAPGGASSDAQLAAELQKVENQTFMTAQLMEKVKNNSSDENASKLRSGRGVYQS